MIRLKPLLTEQPGATIKQGNIDKSGLVVPFNAKKIADLIYNAKGYISDDEQLAKNAIVKNIKNIAQYKQVSAELMKLSGNRGIGQYLASFMNLSDRLEVAGQLMNVLPKNQWEWTIKKIVPYEDLKYITAGGSKYSKISGSTPSSALASNAATTLINTVYNKEWQGRRGELTNDAIHDLFMTAVIVSAPLAGISAAGLAFSSAIGLADATRYFKEGDSYTGGLMTVFSVLPGIGPLGKKLGIPAAQWTKTFLVGLAKKLGSKAKLTPLESKTAQLLIKNKKLVFDAYDDFVSKLIGKNSSKLAKFSDSAKQAINATIKDPKSKIAATLGLYMGAADVYDYAYWRKYSVKPEQAKAMIDQTQQEILDESMQSLDRMIAAKKKNKQIARVEHAGSDKSSLKEAGIEKLNPTPWLDAISMDASSIFITAAVLGGRKALNGLIQYSASMASKFGWTTLSKLDGFRVPGFVKITDLLYRGIKALFVGRDKAFKGYRMFSVNVKDLEMILEKLKQHQINEYQKIHNMVATGKMTAEEAMTYYRNMSWASKLKPVEGQLQNKLILLEKTAPPKNTSNRVTVTGYQQSSKNKTSKGQQGQKDLDKYFVPRNMSIDDYDKLDYNTQSYIQNNNLDWTYDQALRWQKR